MIRFAVAVTAVELALTLGAVVFISVAESGEPYLAREEFESLGIPVEKYSTDRRLRFGALFSYDTHAYVKAPGPAITLSLRVNAPREEFSAREAGERQLRPRDGDERPVVNDESWPGEPGYAVRHRGRHGVRSELVRLHGKELLIVRVVATGTAAATSGEEAAKCERLARTVLGVMVRKLGWRGDPMQ